MAQLYIRDHEASLIRPVRELKGFEKILIKAGESKEVVFEIAIDDLAFWHENREKRAENGEFSLWISPDSEKGEDKRFKVSGL